MILKLDDNCDFINGGSWTADEYDTTGYPVLKVSNFDKDGISFNDLSYLKISSFEKYKRNQLDLHDIVIATVGSHPSLINSAAGRCLVVPKIGQGLLLNQNAVCLKTKNNKVIDQRYLGYLCKSEIFQHFIQQRGKGAANQMRIPISGIKDFEYDFPEINTQRKIASILSSYDDLIENNLKRIKLLEEKAQRTYEEWFVKMRFPGHETSVFNQETGLPEGWEKVKVDTLLDKVKSTTKIKSSEILSNGKFPVIDQSRDFVAGYTDDETALLEINEPLIVFGDHTRIVKFVNFNFARGADGTQLILSNSKRMPQHLFYQTLLSIDLSNYHYARHFKFLKDCEVLLPIQPVSESYEIIAKPMYEMINKLRTQNRLLKEARDILLPRLMSGMVDVEELVGLDAGEVECVDKTKI
ncbi:MAG: type restriction/modification system, specificity subunit [Bacteroidota bacterium]|jgi:type I restriction enzyme S subunit